MAEIELREKIFDIVTDPPCHYRDETGRQKWCEFWDVQGHYCFLKDMHELPTKCKLIDQILQAFKEAGWQDLGEFITIHLAEPIRTTDHEIPAKSLTEGVKEALHKIGYVQLGPDQGLPEVDMDIHLWRDYTPNMAYEKAQQDMLKANFRKIREG